MSTLREAAQQALEAMEYHVEQTRSIWKTSQAIDALRAALAQPEPRNQCGETCERAKLCAVCARGLQETAQTPCDMAEDGVCEVIDCCRNSAQQEQEPVAWRSPNVNPSGGFVIFQQYPQALADLGRVIEPLYTAPPRREWQGLSEEDMEELLPLYSDPSANTEILEFAAAIEAKLKEKNA
jgi:hypothetical protein